MKISYDRNSMFEAIKFLREKNPAARKYTELELLERIERSMSDCVRENMAYSGTLGYFVLKEDEEEINDNHFTNFTILVDAGVGKAYNHTKVDK